MSVHADKLGAYDGIKGVFADLDDGGLTDDEALAQIRDLVGEGKGPKRVLITYLVPVNLTVNLAEGSVESAELDSGSVWGRLPGGPVQDADTNQDIDAETLVGGRAIEKAEAIADESGWSFDIDTV